MRKRGSTTWTKNLGAAARLAIPPSSAQRNALSQPLGFAESMLDEPLPAGIFSIGRTGPVPMGSTVPLPRHGSITCDQEIERNAITRARSGDCSVFEITPEGLDLLRLQVDVLTGGGVLGKRIASVERAMTHKNPLLMKCPPAWALVQLQRALAFADDLKQALQEAVARGINSCIAATIGVIHKALRWNSEGLADGQTSEIFPLLNPRYDGVNPLKNRRGE